jgi:integrating conjugative element membrane protein (TIGR03747 family)
VRDSSPQAPFYEGGYKQAVFAPFRFGVSVVTFLFITLLTAWVAQFCAVYLLWSGNTSHITNLAMMELTATQAERGLPPFGKQAGKAAATVHDWLFVKTSIQYITTADPRKLTQIDQGIQRFFLAVLPAVQVFFDGTRLYVLRLMLLFSVVPLVILAYTIGMVDGLVERSVRRACGGNESASLYHRAKYSIASVCGIPAVLYLILPFAIPLTIAAISVAVATGLLARMQWKYYKKYL